MSAIIDRFVATGWERQAYGGKVPTMTHTVTEAALHTRPHPAPGHRRVVLKLSGEVFGGGAVGVDPTVVRSMARQIATVVRTGVQVAVVVGGGNFFRGAELQRTGMDRA